MIKQSLSDAVFVSPQEPVLHGFSSPALVPIAALLLMLCFPSLSVQGASDGIRLWFDVVLPTLAPFMICTQAVASFGGMHLLMKPFYPILRRLFGLSLPGAYILLCGLLCGYPLGARLCADFLRDGTISREEAQYLFAICNHPSPMFLMGYVRGQLPIPVSPVLLLACLYLPVLPLSRLAGRYYRPEYYRSGYHHPEYYRFGYHRPGREGTGPVSGFPAVPAGKRSLEDILMATCDTMVMIGGYMMLFSILSAWVRRIPGMAEGIQALITGLAEITTGVHQICISFPGKRALLPSILAIAFGGLSGIFQTKGVIKNAGLSIRHYVVWKTLHACLSGIFLILFALLAG